MAVGPAQPHSDAGKHRAAALYTLIGTAKLNTSIHKPSVPKFSAVCLAAPSDASTTFCLGLGPSLNPSRSPHDTTCQQSPQASIEEWSRAINMTICPPFLAIYLGGRREDFRVSCILQLCFRIRLPIFGIPPANYHVDADYLEPALELI